MQENGLGWEKTVIGSVLADPETMEVASELRPADFSRSHMLIWQHVLTLHNRNALEPRALIEALRADGDLTTIGSDIGNAEIYGEDYIAELLTYQGHAVDEYVDQVIENSTRRQLREVAALTASEVMTTDRSAEELLDEAERRLLELRRTRVTEGVSLGDILRSFMPTLEGMRAGEIEPAWIPNELAIKDILHYVDWSDFVVIAGRPGDGKSSYMRYEAYKSAERGQGVLTFNLENDEQEYARWAVAVHTGIDSERIRSPHLLSNHELERVRHAAAELQSLPWEIVSLGAPSVTEMERIARAKSRRQNFRMIQVDYLQLVNNGLQSKVQDITMTSQQLRAWAMPNRFGIPVMAASQLNRAIELRGASAEPELSDLRDSGSIEQDATIIIFPRRIWHNPSAQEIARFPENVHPEGGIANVLKAEPVRFYIKKNRNGPTGVTDVVKWSKHCGRYQRLRREDRQ